MRLQQIVCAVLLAGMTVFTASAIPVDKLVSLVQPDGYTFSARLTGDEFFRILKTLDGCAVVKDDNGYYCYAGFGTDGSRFSTGYAVGQDAPEDVISASRDIPYRLLSGMAAEKRRMVRNTDEEPLTKKILKAKGMLSSDGTPVTRADNGTVQKHGIVVLAQYSDVKFTYKKDDFVRMLTQKGYSDNGATGSAIDYFNAQFGDGWNFSFTVSDIVTLPNTRKYYGKNDASGSDAKAAEMVRDACNLADASVDFSEYDDDGDGTVDNVFVFYAGEDEAQGGNEDCIWSHAWELRYGAGISLVLDGVYINRYACTSELYGKDRMAGIGTFCHEYSHTFGLPDFYDTDYESSSGTSAGLWGSTSLMDSGNYNNDGNTPPFYNAIEREYLGIGDPETLAEGTYTLEPVSENGRYLRYDTGTEGEYFLFECRSGEGWDAYINRGTSSASGLLIYHIDKNKGRSYWSDSYNAMLSPYDRWENYNEVNANPEHQCADLIEADGRSDRHGLSFTSNMSGLFFPSGNKAFTKASYPAFTDWKGSAASLSITEIEMQGKNVTFRVSSSSTATLPLIGQVTTEIFQTSALLSWESDVATNLSAYISYDGLEEPVEVVPYSPGKYSILVEGLEPAADYEIAIRFRSEDGTYGSPEFCRFTTKRLPSDNAYPYILFPTGSKNSDGTFSNPLRMPPVIMNAVNASSVEWSIDGIEITDGGDGAADGYITIDRNGTLQARILYKDGSSEVIQRHISLK